MADDRLFIPIRFGVDGAKADVASVEGALDRTIGTVGRLGSLAANVLNTALTAGGAATGLVGAIGGGSAISQFAAGRSSQLERLFATSLAPDFARQAARQTLGDEVLADIMPFAEAAGLHGMSEEQIQNFLSPIARESFRQAQLKQPGRFAAKAVVSRLVDPKLSTGTIRDAVEETSNALRRMADVLEEQVRELLGR